MEKIRDLYNFYISVYRTERSPAVRRNYGYNMEKYILRYIGDRRVSEVSPTEVQMLLNAMKGKSQTTIRSVVGDLKLVFRQAYMDGYIFKDISTYLTSPKHQKSRVRRALTPLERGAVIAVAQANPKYYAMLFMMLCGCRPSEAYNIMKEDIDYERETVHIRGTKTELSDRTVPCPRIILSLTRNSPHGLITVSQTGLHVSQETQRRIWHSFFIDCHRYLGGKLYRHRPVEPYPFGKDITQYYLRHEYCTELARNGVDIRITQRLMGHASPEMTLRVYTNLSSDDVCTDVIKGIINKNTPFTE